MELNDDILLGPRSEIREIRDCMPFNLCEAVLTDQDLYTGVVSGSVKRRKKIMLVLSE